MLDKFPVIRENNTLLIQPFGGHIYRSMDHVMNLGVKRHENDLNIEGVAILRRCTGLKTVRDIINEICSEFDDTPNSVEPKVVNFLEDAKQKGYVSIQEMPNPAPGFIKGTTEYITPFKAILEITSACNLRCMHCFGDFHAGTKDELSTDEILRILDTLQKMGTEGLNITGGEPLLRKDLLEILDYCYGKFSFSLLTNGTLIDDNFSSKFSEYRPSPIQVSLHGYKAEDHEFITGLPGSFNRTINGIKSLVNNGIYVMVAYLYRPGDIRYIERMAEFCADLEVSMLRVGINLNIGRGENLMWEPSQYEFRQVSSLLEKLDKKYGEKMDIEPWNPGGEMSKDQEAAEKGKKEMLKCEVGSYFVVVNSRGDFFPCGMIRWKFGNLIEDNLEQLIEGEASQFFSTIYAPNYLLCGDCEFLYICMKCHAEAVLHFPKVKECPWRNQFENAPEVILENLQKIR